MTQPIQDPQNILSDIKNKIANAVNDRNHGFHTPIYTNIKNNGNISSRVVVLRNFNSSKNLLNFHTDYRSKKITEIKSNPKAYFVFYDVKDKIQLRISGTSKIHFKNKLAIEAWGKTKLSSRKCYLANKAPSTITNKSEDSIPVHLIGIDPKLEESQNGYNNFCVIETKINSIDWLYLSAKGHRRLLFDLSKKNISFDWLIP